MKLKKLVKISPGLNTSRLDHDEVKNLVFYDKDAFDLDLRKKNKTPSNYEIGENSLKEGDLILYSISNQLAKVGKCNEGMVPSLNFSKVEVISELLDRDYFIYMFNESDHIRKQKERELQGLHILKLPLSALYDIDIPIIPIEIQEKIGRAYMETLRLRNLTKDYNDLLEVASMQLLSMKVREENDKKNNSRKRNKI
ncbi:MAG: restriction endonuclease subunit S [Tissierellia bacterium]|nr:restriction endonuclease subunit S [Tissierellia bacterium]